MEKLVKVLDGDGFGGVYTRENLLDRVWGYTYEGYERTVDTHIRWEKSPIPAARGGASELRFPK